MFDLRGSGRSMGSNQTLAHREPRDVLVAYDHMLSLGYAADQMTVLGNSMGAATVIEAAPELTAVGALVADGAFADLSTGMQGGLTRFTHLPGILALPAIEASRAFGVLPTLSPVDVVRSLPGRAFLFLHSRGDPLLDVANADQLFAASSNRASRVVVIAGHDHMDAYTHNPHGIHDRLACLHRPTAGPPRKGLAQDHHVIRPTVFGAGLKSDYDRLHRK